MASLKKSCPRCNTLISSRSHFCAHHRVTSDSWRDKRRAFMMSERNPMKSKEAQRKVSLAKTNKPLSKQHIENMSRSARKVNHWWKPKTIFKKGTTHPNWKGGITPINKALRKSAEYKQWRKAVFERDNYTCVWCFQHGGNLQADHIKPFAFFPELRFVVDNGRTLCISCHKKTDTIGRPKCTPRSLVESCAHLLKHTERLWKGNMVDFTKQVYVIETYCADCGQFLKQVEIKN